MATFRISLETLVFPFDFYRYFYFSCTVCRCQDFLSPALILILLFRCTHRYRLSLVFVSTFLFLIFIFIPIPSFECFIPFFKLSEQSIFVHQLTYTEHSFSASYSKTQPPSASFTPADSPIPSLYNFPRQPFLRVFSFGCSLCSSFAASPRACSIRHAAESRCLHCQFTTQTFLSFSWFISPSLLCLPAREGPSVEVSAVMYLLRGVF